MPTSIDYYVYDADFHDISLGDAAAMTAAFRTANPDPATIIGGFFGKAALIALLAQSNTTGMRYYYAIDDNGAPTLVLVGVDQDGNDLTDGRLCERAISCPDQCSESNDLNGL